MVPGEQVGDQLSSTDTPQRSVERAGGADANDMAQQDRVGVGADAIAANASPTPCDAWPDTLDSVEDFQAAPSGRSRAGPHPPDSDFRSRHMGGVRTPWGARSAPWAHSAAACDHVDPTLVAGTGVPLRASDGGTTLRVVGRGS
jgi:hypothetical protein